MPIDPDSDRDSSADGVPAGPRHGRIPDRSGEARAVARPHPARPDRDPAEATGRIDSTALFAGHHELVIVHQGREYRLRVTQSGKLILTA